jgi:hypothetical protein
MVVTRGAGAHSTSVRIGFPLSTNYLASSAALPMPAFFTAWIVSAGTSTTSPALSVVGVAASVARGWTSDGSGAPPLPQSFVETLTVETLT